MDYGTICIVVLNSHSVEFEYNTDSIVDDYIFLGLFDGHSYFISKKRIFMGESRDSNCLVVTYKYKYTGGARPDSRVV